MKRITFKIATPFKDHGQWRDGYLAPGMDGLFALYRGGDSWCVTHIPTGYLISNCTSKTIKEAMRRLELIHRIAADNGARWKSKHAKLIHTKRVRAAIRRHPEFRPIVGVT